MKPTVVIINTARGAVMDEAALVQALKEGKVASAGLDVFEDEPNVHPGLLENPHVLLLPHMGTWTVEVSLDFLDFGLWMEEDGMVKSGGGDVSEGDEWLICGLRHRHKRPWSVGILRMCERRSRMAS